MHMVVTVDIDDINVDKIGRIVAELRGDLSKLRWQIGAIEERVMPEVAARRRAEGAKLVARDREQHLAARAREQAYVHDPGVGRRKRRQAEGA